MSYKDRSSCGGRCARAQPTWTRSPGALSPSSSGLVFTPPSGTDKLKTPNLFQGCRNWCLPAFSGTVAENSYWARHNLFLIPTVWEMWFLTGEIDVSWVRTLSQPNLARWPRSDVPSALPWLPRPYRRWSWLRVTVLRKSWTSFGAWR